MKCEYCGGELDYDSSECRYCGAPCPRIPAQSVDADSNGNGRDKAGTAGKDADDVSARGPDVSFLRRNQMRRENAEKNSGPSCFGRCLGVVFFILILIVLIARVLILLCG